MSPSPLVIQNLPIFSNYNIGQKLFSYSAIHIMTGNIYSLVWKYDFLSKRDYFYDKLGHLSLNWYLHLYGHCGKKYAKRKYVDRQDYSGIFFCWKSDRTRGHKSRSVSEYGGLRFAKENLRFFVDVTLGCPGASRRTSVPRKLTRTRNLVPGPRTNDQSFPLPCEARFFREERPMGARGEPKRDQEHNLTYQLASRSEGLTPRGPLTVCRFVFEVWELETRTVHSFYNIFIRRSFSGLGCAYLKHLGIMFTFQNIKNRFESSSHLAMLIIFYLAILISTMMMMMIVCLYHCTGKSIN